MRSLHKNATRSLRDRYEIATRSLRDRYKMLHYNWKYEFLRPSIEEIVKRYKLKFHSVHAAFAAAPAPAAPAPAAPAPAAAAAQ